MTGIKGKSGGSRPGAGRKRIEGQTKITILIDPDNIEYLNTKKNKTRFINELIRREMKNQK